jgi:hypothetical protein
MASIIVSPMRDAGRLLMSTVGDPSITTPGPCGGIGSGVTQAWMSAPPAALVIVELICASCCVFTNSSAAFAAGAPGVPIAAAVAAAAVFSAMSDAALAAWSPAAAAVGIARQAGRNPMSVFRLPGPGVSTGGNGCTTGSVIRAAGGISTKILTQPPATARDWTGPGRVSVYHTSDGSSILVRN